jgi:hypothetical protein
MPTFESENAFTSKDTWHPLDPLLALYACRGNARTGIHESID